MSNSGRRRISKWDLKEDISPENHCDNALSRKGRSSFHEHESKNDLSGRRDLQKTEHMTKETTPGFDGDRHYATRESTGLDGLRHQNRTHSPRRSGGRSYRSRSRSKSRSRSPPHNPQQDANLKNDRSSRSGRSAPLCRDFAAGRCRKGDLCRFAHHGSLDHESRKHLERRVGNDQERMHRDDEALRSHSDTCSTGGRSTNICNDFLKGRCRRGGSCKYLHHDSGSDEYGRRSKFSHHHNEHVYPERRSLDERQPKQNVDGMREVQSDSKWGDTTSLRSVLKAQGWDEGIAQGVSAETHYAPGLLQTDAPGDYIQQNPSVFVDSALGTANNASSYTNFSVASDIPPGQGIHRVNDSFSASPIACVNDVRQNQPTFPLNPSVEVMQIPYHQAVLDTSVSHHSAGEDMQKFQHQPVLNSEQDDGTYMAKADVSQAASGPILSQSNILSGQLPQISHLSTPLSQLFEKGVQSSQLFEKGEQSSQLYAAVAQRAVMDSGSDLPDSSTSVTLAASHESIRHCDPLCDSMETKVASTSNELLSNSAEQRSYVLGTSEIPSEIAIPTSSVAGNMTSSDILKVGSSGDVLGHQNLQGQVSKEEGNEATVKGANEAQEQGPIEDMAGNDVFDDDKKAKDGKGMRPFKFALVEFVKELLQPTWKEGQMSKEVYKTIVKKVVDKVTDSMQAAHVPRTKEKIDQYLSFSKPKLSKLVQAYLEKYQKT